MNEEKRLTPIQAIKANCLDCCCGDRNEVKLCPIESCPLFPYRLGKNPNCKREYTEEQKERMREMGKRLRSKHAENAES